MNLNRKTLLQLLFIFTLSFAVMPAFAQEFGEPPYPDGFPLPPPMVDREPIVSTDGDPDIVITDEPPRREISFYSGSGQPSDIDEADGMEEDASEVSSSGGQSYTIKKGDTLGSISRKFYGTTKHWKKIASANGITNVSNLKVGRVIQIPGITGKASTKRARSKKYSSAPVQSLPSVESLPPVSYQPPSPRGDDMVLYQEKGLPRVILPETGKSEDTSRNNVTFDGLTGLTRTFAAYPLGKNVFSTSFGVIYNKITKRDGNRLRTGEDGDYYQFPIALTYAGENFEAAMCLPFESYDVFAPITYNFRDGSDSGMGDAALRLKFSSQNEHMASALGLGAIFPTNDRKIGNTDTDNAWEVFGGVSTKRKEGGNIHVNCGYQAGSGNTAHEGVFLNVGFDYKANESFNFMGEINSYNRVNDGRATDLTLGMRYFVKPGMTVSLSAPISLKNDMFFGYDYRLQGQLQYHY